MSEAIRPNAEFDEVLSLYLMACREECCDGGPIMVQPKTLTELIRGYRAQTEIALRSYHGGHTHALYEVAKDLESAKWSTHRAAGWASQLAAELRTRADLQEQRIRESVTVLGVTDPRRKEER